MTTITDGKAATLMARRYFEDTYGALSVFGFEVDSVKHDHTKRIWTIKCRFYPFYGAIQKTGYEVLISDDSEVLDVEKLSLR